MRVPVTPLRHLADHPQLAAADERREGRVRARRAVASSKTPGSPRWNDIAQVLPSRSTSTSSRSERALTTEAPTPCRPPEAAYDPEPNLPPAWSLVKTTSTPLSPVFGSMSTGMPRARVAHLDAVVGVQDDLDVAAVTGERLVDGVVDDLPEAVHEAAGVGRADVHARALAHRLEALEHGEVPGRIVRARHERSLQMSRRPVRCGRRATFQRKHRDGARYATDTRPTGVLRVERNSSRYRLGSPGERGSIDVPSSPVAI